jgi:hypothetical protein
MDLMKILSAGEERIPNSGLGSYTPELSDETYGLMQWLTISITREHPEKCWIKIIKSF